MRTKRGFTLIELLVVIAIIAVLATILLPVLMLAREKGRQSSCLSNEKQIMTGVLMYSQDYDERYPVMQYETWTDNILTLHDWPELLANYLHNGGQYGYGGIWACPSSPGPELRRDYSANWAVFRDGQVSWVTTYPGPSLVFSQVSRPADTVLLIEHGYNDTWTPGINHPWAYSGFPPDPSYWNAAPGTLSTAEQYNRDQENLPAAGAWPSGGLFPRYRHTGTANVTFADGHCKAVYLGELEWEKNITPYL